MARSQYRILTHPSDVYSVLLVLGMLVVMAVPYRISMGPLAAFAWIVAAGFLNIAVNLVNHNHVHVRTFRVAWLNRVFEILLTLARGSSATFIAMIHNLNHHRHEMTSEDWFETANQGHGPRPLRPFVYVWRTVRRFRQGLAGTRIPEKARRAILLERVVLNAALLGLLILDWKTTLVFVLLPLVVGNGFVVLTNLLHHDGAETGSGVNNSISYLNPLENLLYLNGGYHAMHHLEPSLHWSQLKSAHQLKIAPHAGSGMVRGSMFYHLATHYLLAEEYSWRFRLLPDREDVR